MLTEDQIKDALRAVKYPGYSRDIVSFGLVKQIATKNGAVSVVMELGSGQPEAAHQIKSDCERVLNALPDVNLVHVEVRQPAAPAAALGFDALPRFASAIGGLFAAAGRGCLDGRFDRFTGLAGALLNAAQQLILLAFGELEIVIREFGPLLFQLALGDVPIPFDFEFGHSAFFRFAFRLYSPPT